MEEDSITSEPMRGWRLVTNHYKVALEWLLLLGMDFVKRPGKFGVRKNGNNMKTWLLFIQMPLKRTILCIVHVFSILGPVVSVVGGSTGMMLRPTPCF